MDSYIEDTIVLSLDDKLVIFKEMNEWFNTLENQTENTHIIWQRTMGNLNSSPIRTKEYACTVLIARFLMHTRQTNLNINSGIKLVDTAKEARRQFRLFIDSNSYQIITKLMEQNIDSYSLIGIIDSTDNLVLSATYKLMN